MSSENIVIIGGGPAGLEAANGVAELGGKAILVEQRDRLGGTPDAARYAALTHHFMDAEEVLGKMIAGLNRRPNVDLRLGSKVTAISGSAGNFTLTLQGLLGEDKVSAGAVIVCTGFDHFDPGRETQMYGYYEFDDVITLTDAEAMLKDKKFVRPSNGEIPQRVCFIQCVGSRDRRIGNEYCSKVCCGIASKQAIEIRQLLPSTKVFIFYIDMRMYGYWEQEIYWPAQEQYKVQYVRGIVSEILKKGDRLLIRGEDTTMGRPMEITMDMVILSVGMEPSKGTKEIAKILGIPQDKYGFLQTSSTGLDTVSTAAEGIFVAGAAAGPRDLDDAISMAGAAAMKAVGLVRRKAQANHFADRG
jgi:heterodisulfide reductase subunit A